jgi:flagellar biosynthetic protein FlhB
MAEASHDGAEKTEAATPRRVQKAREAGQVPLSTELPALAMLGATSLVLVLAAPAATRRLALALAGMLAHAADATPLAALQTAILAGARAAAPLALIAAAAAAAAVVLQTGFLLRPQAIRPDLSRLSPAAGLHRLFGMQTLLAALKAVVKAVAVAVALGFVLKDALPALREGSFWSAEGLGLHFATLLLRMLCAVLLVQAAVSLFDLVWVRLRHARDLRMSREELREELRETEGDPLLRGRLRQIRQRRARQRMLAAVPKATVVVTNPTHYAVALHYDRAAGGAPRVVAKGVDAVAARIRAVAEENKVPLVANPPLARALWRVELDSEIPPEHFQAVAEIIAYVLRLRRRAPTVRP